MEPCLGYLNVLPVNENNLGLIIHNYATMCTTEIGTSKILKVKPLGQLIRYSLSGLEICLRGSVSGHYPAPLAKLGQRCHFEFLPVNGAHAPSCETGGGGNTYF